MMSAAEVKGLTNNPNRKLSFPEEMLALHLKALKIPFAREHRFHPTREWRFDFAFLDRKLAVEVEGGIQSNGRHVRPAGFIADLEKYAEAVLHGWTVLRVAPGWVRDGTAIAYIERLLK